MPNIFLSHNNIISPLGFSSLEVVGQVKKEISGIRLQNDTSLFHEAFYASKIDSEAITHAFQSFFQKEQNSFTKLEQLMLLSLNDILNASKIELTNRVGLIISTTKGNIDTLKIPSNFPKERAYLHELGKIIKNTFGFKNEAIVVSNACISGILAVSIAKRYMELGVYDHVFIVSGDVLSEFVISGFNSFQAISDAPCKPYSKDRNGITLGEAVASILVTSNEKELAKEAVQLLGDASKNDANHISGPSRTGEGLYLSMEQALKEAAVKPEQIDYISAHGTATPFNDDMESIAFNRAGLNTVPLNSLKGYFGHTLGASGLLETIVAMHSINQQVVFTSKGSDNVGVVQSINVIQKPETKKMTTFLKTASGFGGCNAAAVFSKVNL